MALRSLGSSLVAKASPGSVSRDTREQRIAQPNIPGKGAPGSIDRELVEDPSLSQVPSGSERIVRTGPGVDETSQPGLNDIADAQLLEGAMGLPMNQGVEGQDAAQPSEPLRGDPNNTVSAPNETFTSAIAPTPASAVARGGRTARVLGMGSNLESAAPETYGAPTGESVTAKAQNQILRQGLLPSAMSFLSGRVAADNPLDRPTYQSKGIGATGVQDLNGTTTFNPTAGQFIAGGAGKAVTAAGKAVNNALGTNVQLAPGGLGAKMQTFGGAPTVAAQGTASISKVVQNISNALRSLVQNISKPQSAPAKNTGSKDTGFKSPVVSNIVNKAFLRSRR